MSDDVKWEALDALQWAQTFIYGRLPDLNTQTPDEIKAYRIALCDKIDSAISRLEEDRMIAYLESRPDAR